MKRLKNVIQNFIGIYSILATQVYFADSPSLQKKMPLNLAQ